MSHGGSTRDLVRTSSCLSEPLVDYETLGGDATLAVPTADHYLPLLYVLGTWQREEAISFPVEGVDGGSVSMLAVRVG